MFVYSIVDPFKVSNKLFDFSMEFIQEGAESTWEKYGAFLTSSRN